MGVLNISAGSLILAVPFAVIVDTAARDTDETYHVRRVLRGVDERQVCAPRVSADYPAVNLVEVTDTLQVYQAGFDVIRRDRL